MAESTHPAGPASSAGVHPPAKLKVTQIRSTIGCKENQRATLKSLGLRKIRQSVERDDNPQIRGMIRAVRHLVAVEEVSSS